MNELLLPIRVLSENPVAAVFVGAIFVLVGIGASFKRKRNEFIPVLLFLSGGSFLGFSAYESMVAPDAIRVDLLLIGPLLYIMFLVGLFSLVFASIPSHEGPEK